MPEPYYGRDCTFFSSNVSDRLSFSPSVERSIDMVTSERSRFRTSAQKDGKVAQTNGMSSKSCFA